MRPQAPTQSRSALVIGKALSSSIRGLSQALVVYICAAMMGVRLSFNPSHVLMVVLLIVVGSGLFSTFSLIIACVVKTRERFMGIGQVLTMPIFFASNAIYPISLMPGWLKTVSSLNPLTYEVDGLRSMMLEGGVSSFGIATDFSVLVAAMAIVTMIRAIRSPRCRRVPSRKVRRSGEEATSRRKMQTGLPVYSNTAWRRCRRPSSAKRRSASHGWLYGSCDLGLAESHTAMSGSPRFTLGDLQAPRKLPRTVTI
jgi:hypothetical protein